MTFHAFTSASERFKYQLEIYIYIYVRRCFGTKYLLISINCQVKIHQNNILFFIFSKAEKKPSPLAAITTGLNRFLCPLPGPLREIDYMSVTVKRRKRSRPSAG